MGSGSSDRSFIGGLAHELAVNQLHQIANRTLVRSTDLDSQDKNLVSSLDRFAKTASLHDSVDLILTHVNFSPLANCISTVFSLE